MSMVREAEVLEMPTHGDTDAIQARRIAQGRSAVERYVERLENATERLKTGPEASELYCALAELREGMIENDPERVADLYKTAIESFGLSRPANRGLRRLARSQQNVKEVIRSLEQELAAAPEPLKKNIQLELVRTWLYAANDPEKAILMLENIENADSDASTLVPENETEFDAETFLLWEDALLSTGAWDRYEGKLIQALRKQTDTGFMTQHIEERLWLIYRYIMPDDEQARMLCDSLMKQQPLDDELVEDELLRSLKEAKFDSVARVLKNAIERLENSPRAHYYTSLLANIALFEFEDRDYAMDLLDSVKDERNLALLHQQICLLAESDRTDLLLDTLTRCLEFTRTPQLKAELLYKIACILRDEMDQDEAAVDVFSEANAICPTHEPTIEALVEFYTEAEDWEHISSLYDYEISYAKEHQLVEYSPEVFIARHARLARIFEDKLHFYLNAFNNYQAILKYRPDDIAALKGAGRMAQKLGNWTELLQLYAAAEGCTQDLNEHVYLLDRIAHIADVYLNDADTACTALEALRSLDARRDATTPALARLYIKLQKWDELIELTNDEIETTTNPEYKATLLCRNAEISETELSNIPQAVLYYEKARSVSSSCRMASAELERIYAQQKSWEKLIELIKSEVALCNDIVLKCAYLRKMAKILDEKLDCEDESVAIYESALKLDPCDSNARQFLLDYYASLEKWEEVLRILHTELKAGGTMGYEWLTHFYMARIELYRIKDENRALKSFEKAFRLNPNDMTLLRYWLSLSLCIGDDEQTLECLKEVLPEVTADQTHDEIEFAIADLMLRKSHDPETIETMIAPYENSNKFRSRGARLLTTMLVAVNSANGRWISRLSLALQPRQSADFRKHALMSSLVLNIPDEIREGTQDVLCNLSDLDLARHIWASLSPAKRPNYKKLPVEILRHPSRESQDLRRWVTISQLLAGVISDPTDTLLPDDRDENISYRPDLELLAAYFERFEKWEKLLEVLNVQEETLNQLETIQITLQKAWVLTKISRPEDALASIRKACAQCLFDNPMRLSLYDYLSHEKDWDFLAEQIRQHLMNTDDNLEKSALWLRLAEIYSRGLQNLEEALRCLDCAYQEDPSQGHILCEISETAQNIGELDIARRALDDYIFYHKPSLEEQLQLEPKLLELHFKYTGGDVERMLRYFDELVNKTGRSRDCLIILARAHAIAGNPQIAAEILLQVVSVPIEEKDLDLWIILGDLFLDRLNQQTKGEQLLWELFKVFPHIEYVFDRLNNLYKEPAERRIMVANLRDCVRESEVISRDHALVRKYLGFAADTLGSGLGAWKEAQELYTEAIEASSEPSPELAKNRAYARSRIHGEARKAYREFCELLVHDPFQVDIYKAAIDICRRSDARDRERIIKQLASVFVPNAGLFDESHNPKLMDARQLNDDVLIQKLTHPKLRNAQVLIHEAMPILKNFIGGAVPRQTDLGTERIRDERILQLFSTCAQAFSINSFKAINGHDDSPVPVVLDDPNILCFSLDAWETMPNEMRRHWAGYACGLLWTGVSKLVWCDPNEVWQLLDGIYCTVTGKGIIERDAYTNEAVDRLNSTFAATAFQRGIRRDVANLIDQIGPQNLPKRAARGWNDGLLATADRAGLLFSGSLASSIPAILQAEGWNPNKKDSDYLAARFKLSNRIPDLIEFALSDDYLDLRYSAGLSMPKSTISG